MVHGLLACLHCGVGVPHSQRGIHFPCHSLLLQIFWESPAPSMCCSARLARAQAPPWCAIPYSGECGAASSRPWMQRLCAAARYCWLLAAAQLSTRKLTWSCGWRTVITATMQ